MGRKRDFQTSGVVLYSFYVQILPTNLISSLSLKVRPKVKFSSPIGWN